MNKEKFLNQYLFKNLNLDNKLDNINNTLHTKHKTLNNAAVLIPIVKRQRGLTIILTERALHLRHHPGQISFPGGKYEQHDNNLMNTALRETEEEIGILETEITIIGKLTPITTNSGFLVTPFIAFIEEEHTIKIDEQEVRRILEVPVNFLLDEHNFYLHTLIAEQQLKYSKIYSYN